MAKKIIAWENWNEKEIEGLEDEFTDISDIKDLEELADGLSLIPQSNFMDMGPQVIHTPFGPVDPISKLKPSDRWDCWLGYTNFDLTRGVSDKLAIIGGVDALKIMSRYTFCIGIGKLFQFKNVRKDIEDAICK
jgi:hypothetical protein